MSKVIQLAIRTIMKNIIILTQIYNVVEGIKIITKAVKNLNFICFNGSINSSFLFVFQKNWRHSWWTRRTFDTRIFLSPCCCHSTLAKIQLDMFVRWPDTTWRAAAGNIQRRVRPSDVRRQKLNRVSH